MRTQPARKKLADKGMGSRKRQGAKFVDSAGKTLSYLGNSRSQAGV